MLQKRLACQYHLKDVHLANHESVTIVQRNNHCDADQFAKTAATA